MNYFKIELSNTKLTPFLPKIKENQITIHLTKNNINYEIRDKEFSIIFTNRKGYTNEINSLENGSISLIENSRILLNLSKEIIKYNGIINCEMLIRNSNNKQVIDRNVFLITSISDTSLLKEMQSKERYETLEQLINKVEGLDQELAKNIIDVLSNTTVDITNHMTVSKETINTSVTTAIDEIDNKVNNVYAPK